MLIMLHDNRAVVSILHRNAKYLKTIQKSVPVGGEIIRACLYRPRDPPTLPYNGYRDSLPGLKRPGRGVNPSYLGSRLKKEQSHTSIPPLCLHGTLLGDLYFFINKICNHK